MAIVSWAGSQPCLVTLAQAGGHTGGRVLSTGVWQVFESPHHPAPGVGGSCWEGCVGVSSEGCAFIPKQEEPLPFLELLQGLKEWGNGGLSQPLNSVVRWF